MDFPKRWRMALWVALFFGLTPAFALAVPLVYESPLHVFSMDDVQGGFNGSTYGPAGDITDTGIFCGVTTPCPGEIQPFVDKDGTTLFRIK